MPYLGHNSIRRTRAASASCEGGGDVNEGAGRHQNSGRGLSCACHCKLQDGSVGGPSGYSPVHSLRLEMERGKEAGFRVSSSWWGLEGDSLKPESCRVKSFIIHSSEVVLQLFSFVQTSQDGSVPPRSHPHLLCRVVAGTKVGREREKPCAPP